MELFVRAECPHCEELMMMEVDNVKDNGTTIEVLAWCDNCEKWVEVSN